MTLYRRIDKGLGFLVNEIGPTLGNGSAVLATVYRRPWRVLNAAAAGLTASLLTCGSSNAACRPLGPLLTEDMLAAFVSQPSSILIADASTERGSAELAIAVSQYAAADPTALAALVTVLPEASVGQRSAIGQGLYRAFDVCTAADPKVAARIAVVVRKISDPSVIRAYRLKDVAATVPSSPASGALPTGESRNPPESLIGDVTSEPTSLKITSPFLLPGIR